MGKDIRYRWILEHDPSFVWEHLTNPELIGQWLMKNDFKPVIGHKFMFHARPSAELNFDGEIYCEVLEIIPLKRLSYSWKCGPEKGNINLDSVVTWTLKEDARGTELLLEHTGFMGEDNNLYHLQMSEGWAKIGSGLEKKLNDKKNNATNR